MSHPVREHTAREIGLELVEDRIGQTKVRDLTQKEIMANRVEGFGEVK